MPFAFRCKNCGRLETPANSGESAHPHACTVCGSGVSFDPKSGVKTLDSGNWECLHDASDERLTELGLTRTDVCQHTEKTTGPAVAGNIVNRAAVDGAGAQDKAG